MPGDVGFGVMPLQSAHYIILGLARLIAGVSFGLAGLCWEPMVVPRDHS